MVSRTMVGMAGKNRGCPVKLLAKHHAGQLVRPGQGAERHNQLGLIAQRLIVTISPADGDDKRLAAAVSQKADAAGEILGGKIPAALIEQYQRGTVLQLHLQLLAFLAAALSCRLRAALRNL